AVLAISPHLTLRPTILSFVLLGLTLFILQKKVQTRGVWLLPVVCLLWVNLDAWFLLGPLTIALYVLGGLRQKVVKLDAPEVVATRRRPEDGSSLGQEPRAPLARLGAVLGLSILACLLNPYHIHAFTLPVPFDFSSASAMLSADPQFRGLFLSPWEKVYFEYN